MWGAVRRLKEIGLDVVCVVADGAKPNRKFFRDHAHEDGMNDGVVYKARNIFEPSKWIYLISDIPHLIKTTINCWANSRVGGTRLM